jgi:hypothetical protein
MIKKMTSLLMAIVNVNSWAIKVGREQEGVTSVLKATAGNEMEWKKHRVQKQVDRVEILALPVAYCVPPDQVLPPLLGPQYPHRIP